MNKYPNFPIHEDTDDLCDCAELDCLCGGTCKEKSVYEMFETDADGNNTESSESLCPECAWHAYENRGMQSDEAEELRFGVGYEFTHECGKKYIRYPFIGLDGKMQFQYTTAESNEWITCACDDELTGNLPDAGF